MPAPKFNPQPPISAPQVKELKEALEIMLPGPLGLSEAPFRNKYKRWNSPMKLSKEVLEWTQQDDVKDAYYVLTQWQETYSNPPEYETPTMTGAPESPVSATTPTESLRAQQAADLERRNADIKASVEKAKAQTQAEIARRQEYAKQRQIIRDQVTKTRVAQTELQGKRIPVRVELPKNPVLSQNEQTAYTRLKDLSQKNPVQIKEELSAAIQEKIPTSIKQNSTPEEVKLYADTVATQAVANLRMASPPPPDVETAILVTAAINKDVLQKAVSKPDTQKILGQGLNDLARIRMTAYQAPANALDMIVGPNVRKLILGPSPAEIHASFQSQGATHELDLGKLNTNYQSALQNPIFSYAQDEIKGKVLDFGKQQLLSRLSSFPPDSALGKLAASNQFKGALTMLQPYTSFEFVGAEGLPGIFGKFVMQFSPESAPLLSGFGNMMGIDFGIAPISSAVTPIAADALAVTGGELVGETAVVATTEVVTTTTGAVGGTGAGLVIGQFVIPIPAIGAAIGAAIGWVGGKIAKIIPWKKVKENILPIATFALLFGLVFKDPFLIAGGGAGIAGNILLGGLPFSQRSFSRFFRGVGNIFRIWVSAIAIALGTPILIILVIIPILTALMIIIINSGAYMVPPSQNSLLSTNPYIQVDKVADPPGPFQNTDLPLTISYTVTVTAKKSTLTNVQFTNTCQIITTGPQEDCPAVTPPAPATIEPSSPFVFTYEETYTGSQYNDSIVIDTFKVTANTIEQGNVETSGSATISIGNPPTACLSIDEAQWPSEYYTYIFNARATLVSNFSNYVSKVCLSYTDLPLKYNPVGNGNLWGWNYGTYIDFYQLGVKDQASALYILSHELGHSLAWGAKTAYIYASYLAYPGIKSEAPYCFYSVTSQWNADESMPEAIALHIIEPQCGTVQQKWPIHYQFLMKYVFN